MYRNTQSERRPLRIEAGMTLLELIIACTILIILASAAVPMARFTVQRRKEAELRFDLREMRDAIDRYKDAADRNLIRVEVGTEGYPPDLDTLVKGVDLVAQPTGGIGATTATGTAGIGQSTNALSGMAGQSAAAAAQGLSPSTGAISTSGAGNSLIRHVRFLRKIPIDPMTGKAEWGMRSVQDDPDSSSWGGNDVFDVFSLSASPALDGTKYSDW